MENRLYTPMAVELRFNSYYVFFALQMYLTLAK